MRSTATVSSLWIPQDSTIPTNPTWRSFKWLAIGSEKCKSSIIFLCLGSSFEDNLFRYEKQFKLAGIIYLHRISDNRMAGTPLRNLRMFGELCGDQAVKKVVLVTTMWDRVQGDTGERREKQLFENYWNGMMKLGASTSRFLNSTDSAWIIINLILEEHANEALLLQEELVDLKRSLNETQAGKTLYSDLQRLLAEQRDTVRSLAEQARDESNPQLARQLDDEYKRIQKDLDKTFTEIKSLKIPLGRKLMQLFAKKSRGVSLILTLGVFVLIDLPDRNH
jgi:hypothetical protein